MLQDNQTPDGKLYIKMGGFHLDPYNAVAENGLINVTEKITDQHDCSYVTFDFAGAKEFEKSQFPNDWTPEMIIRKMVEALKNPMSAEMGQKYLVIEGLVNEGFKIRIVIEKGGTVKTVFPLIENVI